MDPFFLLHLRVKNPDHDLPVELLAWQEIFVCTFYVAVMQQPEQEAFSRFRLCLLKRQAECQDLRELQ
jgi:hypothetical protein